ncbi:MAG: 3-dehydroquinate synthase [Anaerolineae bacterium]|nr:3-dehydroquinate synthase [Anaerolineae bacterium]
MKEITVTAPTAQYPILIGEGLLHSLPALLAEHKLMGKVAVVTNETLAPIYGEPLVKALGNAVLVTVPDGEQYKSLDTVRTLYDAFISAGLDRRAVIVALGGGVVGDMVGFAAATYLRGVAFVQVPTSLLAMVDSSVGGKVGVDVPQGKNLIGAFKQPEMVVVDPSVLKTLPDVEWRCGLAEIVKAGLLRDLRLLDASLYQRDTNDFSFIQWAIQYKVDVVQEDPYENSIRAYLNLGHTFAHALERVSNYGWRHGEAVSVGLVFAARLSAVHGLCAPELPAQVEQLLQTLNMPIRYTGYTPAEIRAAMGTDKKRQDNRVRFILLRAAGDPLLCDDVPDSEALAVIEAIRA